MKPTAWCWEADANGEPSPHHIQAVDTSGWGVDLTKLAQLMPHGVFTTARGALHGGDHLKLSQHDEHIGRLATSLRGKSGHAGNDYERIFDEAFGDFVTDTVEPFLAGVDALSFTVLLMVEEHHNSAFKMGLAIKAYEPAAIPESCSILAVTVEAGRQRPDIKSNEWIGQRRQYEALKTRYGCNEVLLVKEDGHCIEGLSSNFGVVLREADGQLVMRTASTKYVLDGTTMRVVKEHCIRLGIAVDDESEGPSIGELGRWEAAFVCSTSRLLLPVTAIIVDGAERSIASLASEKLLLLRRAVADHLLQD
jgi:branched-subunit amino acid aminotransferase/4-amino-4-deoxychorismate lyase